MVKKYCIVKRKGHEEKFDERKVYVSCYAACLSTRMEVKKAEKLCKHVAAKIKNWIKGKPRVTSDEIFNKTFQVINKYDENAAFMYKSHRDIS